MALRRLLLFILISCGPGTVFAWGLIGRSEWRAPERGWAAGPVWYLMTTREYTAYRSLGTEQERREFIGHFWKERDPIPDTRENELEKEFWRRVNIADRFSQDVKPGWKTERGKVFILLGPPLNLEEDRILDDRYGASRWAYDFSGMPPVLRDVLRESLRVPGDRDRVELKVLDEAEGARSVGGAFVTHSSILRPSGSLRIADSLIARYGSSGGLRHLGELMRVPEVVERARMEVNVSTVFRLIPVEARVDFRRAARTGRNGKDEATSIAVTLGVKDSALVDAGVTTFDPDTAIVSGYLRPAPAPLPGRQADHNLTGTFEPDPRPELHQKTHVFQAVSSLPPGRYDLHLSYRDTNQRVMGSVMSTIEVPSFSVRGLSASSIILSDRLDRLERPDTGRAGSPYSLGSYQVIPRTNPVYEQTEDLTVFYEVHGPRNGPDGRPLLDITYQFYIDDRDAWLPVGGAITKKQTRGTSQAWRVPLGGLPSGKYRLEITVVDRISGESVVREALFEVLGRSLA